MGLYPKLSPVDTGRLPSFGAQISLGRHVHSLARRERISVLGHKFWGGDQKKSSSAWNPNLRLAFTRVFCLETRLYSRLCGGTSSILGGHKPQNLLRCTGPVTFLWGTILAWGSTFFRVGGTSSDLGARPLNAPHGAGPVRKYHIKNSESL